MKTEKGLEVYLGSDKVGILAETPIIRWHFRTVMCGWKRVFPSVPFHYP